MLKKLRELDRRDPASIDQALQAPEFSPAERDLARLIVALMRAVPSDRLVALILALAEKGAGKVEKIN